MGSRLSVKERHNLASSSLDDLAKYCRGENLQRLGSNNRLVLSEIGQRLGVPTDAVSLTRLQRFKTRNYDEYVAYHWGTYTEDRVAQLKKMLGRKWNGTTQCNYYSLKPEEVPAFLSAIRELYNKNMVIDDSGYRIEDGNASAEWNDPVLYELSETPHTVNLGQVLRQFQELRVNAKPLSVALHGNIDPQYRALFGDGLGANSGFLKTINLPTRHDMLLFRIPVAYGKPIYLAYSAKEKRAEGVYFSDSKELNQILAQFKGTQQRLNHPIVAHDPILLDQLRRLEQSGTFFLNTRSPK